MELSIVIVNWNTRELTAQCLDSLRDELAALGGQAEVVLVDNASTDGSLTHLRDRLPSLHLIPNPHNAGFAAANNQGIRRSTGRLILLLNSDTIVHPGALRALLDFMSAHPQAAAAGARLLNPDGSLQPSCFPAPTLGREFWRLFHLDRLRPRSVYNMADWRTDQPREVDNILGACMLLRREIVEQVGGMEEGYFMYSEETDWCLRIRRAGGRVYWVPQAQITHLGGQSTRQAETQMFLALYRSKIMYFRKHHSRLHALAFKLLLLLACAARLLAAPLALLQPPPARAQNLALAGRYWRLVGALPGY
jgi:GT2 family glycosyltransferase